MDARWTPRPSVRCPPRPREPCVHILEPDRSARSGLERRERGVRERRRSSMLIPAPRAQASANSLGSISCSSRARVARRDTTSAGAPSMPDSARTRSRAPRSWTAASGSGARQDRRGHVDHVGGEVVAAQRLREPKRHAQRGRGFGDLAEPEVRDATEERGLAPHEGVAGGDGLFGLFEQSNRQLRLTADPGDAGSLERSPEHVAAPEPPGTCHHFVGEGPPALNVGDAAHSGEHVFST